MFVPTAEEDTQGIPLAPVPTAPASGASGAVPPKAPPVPPTVFLEPPVSPDVAGNSASHPPPPPSASPAEPARIVSATSDQHVAGGSRRLTLAEVGATKVSSTTKAASSPDTPPPPLPSSDGKGGKKPATPAVAKSVPSKPAVAAASAASAAKETAAPPSEGVDVGNLQQLLKTAQDENVRLKTQLCASEDLNKTLQNDCEKYQKTLAAVKAEYEDKMFLAAKAAETSQNALSAHLASLQAELLQNKSIFATLTTQLEQRTAELKAITATSATSPVPSPQGSGTSAATSATGAAGATAQSPFGRSSFSFRTHTRTRSDGSIPPFVLNDTSTTAVSAGVTAAGAGGVSAAGSTTTGTGAVNTSMVIPAALTVGATAGTGLSSAGSFSSSPSERIAQRRGSLIAAATAAVTTTAAVSSTADALAGDSSTSNAAVPLVSAPSVPQSASKVPFSAPPASELHLDVVNHTPLKIRTSSDSNSVLGYSPPLPPSTPVASAAPAVHASAGGGDVPTVGLIRIPSSSALPSLFPNTSENGDCDFEEAELATLPFQQKSKFRPKSHSVKLDGDQFHLQAMLKAEMEKKTPRQRLRPSNDVGILETSSWALGATNSPIPPRSDTPTMNSPMPGGRGAGGGAGGGRDVSSPLITSLQPTAGDITDSRKLSTRDHRLKDSTAELQAFAAQAAAKAMADDKRQSLIAEGHITSAAQVGVPSTGISGGSTAGAPSQGVSLLRRTLVANTSASSNVSLSRCSSPAPSSADSPMMSVSQGIYWEEGNNSGKC